LATKRTSEEEDVFEEDWDDDFSNDEELDDNSDDAEFDYTSLSTSERKRYDKMKAEIENSLVETIAKGETDTPIYKGLQKVLAKRDRQLAETQQALQGLMSKAGMVDETNSDVGFLANIFKEMLDEDGRKVFDERLNQYATQKRAARNEQTLQTLLKQQNGQEQQIPMYGRNEEDDKITEYKRQATKRLQEFAKRMGADPTEGKLDFGDEDEPLLVRMDKLSASIERVNAQADEDTDKVRRKGPRPDTRTRRDPGGKDVEDISYNILERGSQEMISRMRKNVK
jgi:hypothetical protein